MVTRSVFPVGIMRQTGNKNHAPRGVPGRDSGGAGGDLVIFIYLATVTRLRTLVFPVYCPQVQPRPGQVDTMQYGPACYSDQRQFAGTNRGGMVLLEQTQPSAPATTVTGLSVTVSPLSTLPGATCLYSTVMIPVNAAAVTLDT